MAVSISTSIVVCLKVFNQLIEQIQDPKYEKAPGLVLQSWQDELGRLRVWAANIGAHQTNQSSLEYRLRDSAHIQQQIVKLLDRVVDRLEKARVVISGAENEDEDMESLGGSSSEDENSQTEVHQLQRSVATIITCLFQMSLLVRKPAQHDLRIGSWEADVAVFEPLDYSHVRDKYPKAEDFVVSRLGHGNTRRRSYLKYRERPALKLKQGINAVADVAVNDNATGGIMLSETIATDVQDWNVKFDDNASQSGISQMSYAPTLMSGGDITIPAPPRSSRGGAPFECPYCYFIVTAQSTRSWNRHVFDDLQPYMCLDKTCNTPHKLYTKRREWVHHAITMHHHEDSGESRDCILCGDPQETAERYDRHVARHLQELALFVLPPNHDESDNEEPCGQRDDLDLDKVSSTSDKKLPFDRKTAGSAFARRLDGPFNFKTHRKWQDGGGDPRPNEISWGSRYKSPPIDPKELFADQFKKNDEVYVNGARGCVGPFKMPVLGNGRYKLRRQDGEEMKKTYDEDDLSVFPRTKA
ncbi:MAG: hypothetical protein L6R42_004794 [Xanthoria sp. 1 TBL-2021]|nr:MAG: hypothetical protein L6R42_004794 [Xanthoria sp. 1 TBL-2021]